MAVMMHQRAGPRLAFRYGVSDRFGWLAPSTPAVTRTFPVHLASPAPEAEATPAAVTVFIHVGGIITRLGPLVKTVNDGPKATRMAVKAPA